MLESKYIKEQFKEIEKALTQDDKKEIYDRWDEEIYLVSRKMLKKRVIELSDKAMDLSLKVEILRAKLNEMGAM